MNPKRILAVVLTLLAAACTDTGSGPASHTSRILLTDSPFPYDRIAQVNMHIVRIEVASTADTTTAHYWTTVAEPNRTIDLLSLQSGTTTVLGETQVRASWVGAVRMTINTTLSSVIRNDGSVQPVRWPVSGELALNAYVQASLSSFIGDTPSNLVIDFDVGRSFEDLGDGRLTFIPWIRALDDAGAGAVSGIVRADPDGNGTLTPLQYAAVTVLSYGGAGTAPTSWYKVATGRTDAQGRYRVAFLLIGHYVVRVEPLGQASVGCKDVVDVLVSNGETTALDVDLAAAPGTCARSTGGGGGLDTTITGGGDTTTVGGAVATVTITPAVLTVSVGDSVGMFARLANASGAVLYGRPVTWTISDSTVVAFYGLYGQSALLRPLRSGSVTVTAMSEGKAGTGAVTVR